MATSNNSFTLKGANPTAPMKPFNATNFAVSPVAKALSKAVVPVINTSPRSSGTSLASSGTSLTPGQFSSMPSVYKGGAQATTPIAQPGAYSATPLSSPVKTETQPLAMSGVFTTPSGTTVTQGGETLSTPSPASTPNPIPASSAAGMYPGLIQNLSRIGTERDPAITRAAENIENIGKRSADTQGTYLTTGTLPVAQGRAQIVAQTASAMQAAEEAKIANLLKEEGQDITALQGAGSLAAPIQIAPGSTAVNPATGEQVAGGLGGYANYQTAQQVMSLISQYPDAGYVYDQAKTPQQNLETFQSEFLPKSPTYVSGLGSKGYIAGAGTSPAQAATNQAYQSVIQDGTQEIATLQGALNAAHTNVEDLAQIVQSAGINPTDVTAVNQFLNNVRTQLNNPATLAYNALLSEARALYASVLQARGGVTPTDAFNQANSQFPNGMTYDALMSQYGTLEGAANAFIGSLQQQVTQAQSALEGQGNSGTPTSTGGTGGLFDW